MKDNLVNDCISRKAAIEIVRKAKDKSEAHRMLVQLPPTQPDHIGEVTEMVGDAVSRQAAIDALSHMMDTDGFRDGWAVSRANVDCMLRSLPSAQPSVSKEEMVGDAVSRQAASEAVCKMMKNCFNATDEMIESVKITVGELPPAQQWIPVAERLPTENNSYLVWMPFTPEGHHITVAEWCGSYWNIKTPITAWMPMPTPWEGGQDG